MKNPHKQETCLNCSFTFDKPDNFCPNCGQENTDYHLSAKEMLQELVQSTFNFDSKFAHSIIPFLFKPGFLPRAFMEGKRKHYVHPVRFYLFISLIFFFIFAMNLNGGDIEIGASDGWSISSSTEIDSAFRQTARFVDLAEESGQIDSAQAAQMRKGIVEMDSKELFNQQLKKEGIALDSVHFMINGEEQSLATTWDIIVNVWLRDKKMTPDRLLDSLKVDQAQRNWLYRKAATQAIKYAQTNDPRMWKKEALDNIPIMMFLLLPIFATILKLLYIRSGRWYIEHLVFTFHIHSFVFFVMSVVFLFTKIMDEDLALVLGLVTLNIYPYLMFRNYYGQGRFKTLLKFVGLGFIYGVILLLALFIEIIISFMML